MTDCPFHSQVEAYHDRELDAQAAGRFERHLQGCTECAVELGRLREFSSSIASAAAELTASELSAMHIAVNREIEQQADTSSLLRTAGMLAALAASLLIVCGIWWLDTRPMGSMGSLGSTGQLDIAASGRPAALSPEWELMATTLRADPSPGVIQDSFFSPHYAATLDFMLNSLIAAYKSSENQSTEPQTWEKPKSF